MTNQIETPPYEVSSIKCYGRPGKEGQKPHFQRRILLKSDGQLQGCPDDPHPLNVAVLKLEDWNQVIDSLASVEKRERALNDLVNVSKNKVESLEKEALQYNERTDELKESYQKQINILEGVIKDLKGTIASLGEDKKNLEKDKVNLQKDKEKLDEDKKNLQYDYDIKSDNLEEAVKWISQVWAIIQTLQDKSRWEFLFGGLHSATKTISAPKDRFLIEGKQEGQTLEAETSKKGDEWK